MRENSVHDSPNGLNTSHLFFLFCRSQHRSSALSKTYPRHPLMRYGPSLSGYCFGNNGQEKDAILNEPPVKSVHVDCCFCLQNKASKARGARYIRNFRAQNGARDLLLRIHGYPFLRALHSYTPQRPDMSYARNIHDAKPRSGEAGSRVIQQPSRDQPTSA